MFCTWRNERTKQNQCEIDVSVLVRQEAQAGNGFSFSHGRCHRLGKLAGDSRT